MKVFPFVLMAVFIIMAIPIASSDCSEEDTGDIPEPIYLGDRGDGKLYMVEMNNGPLYYIETENNGKTVQRIVSSTAIHTSFEPITNTI